MKILVLGAGLQGSACAYDLLQQDDVDQVRLADLHVDHLPPFLAPHSGKGLVPTRVDGKDQAAVAALMSECDAVSCALPYYFNLDMSRLAIEAGAHFCDLGGNTGIVRDQKAENGAAVRAGVTVIPDCGLAPGMVNVLAQHGIERFESVESVRMFVGGLPQNPEPPLNYQIVYSIEGMLDYYTTLSWILRDGKQREVEALSEIELVDFGNPTGTLEAFHTAGGLSTMAARYEHEIPVMEYKTLRYPGHAVLMKAIRDLGLLGTAPILVNGQSVRPRDLFIAAAEPHLRKPEGKDLVALRVSVEGVREGKKGRVTYDLLDLHDAEHGISAMMRTTGYSLSITTLLLARGIVKTPGVFTSDECIPGDTFIAELQRRGIQIRVTETI